MSKKYINIDEAEKELISQCDSLFKLVNEKVKPEDCFRFYFKQSARQNHKIKKYWR